MSENEKSKDTDGLAPGIESMMAFASAMNRAWLSTASLGGFPDAGNEGQPGQPDAWRGVVESQMRIMATTQKSLYDAVMGSIDAAWGGQDQVAEKISEQIADTVRTFTGMDPRDVMPGSKSEWSPQAVAAQSFGLADSDAAALAGELAQFAMTSSEAARTLFDLYRVVGDAWVDAGDAFAEANVENSTNPADPAALQRQWAATAEPILQKTLASESFVEANADFIRATSRQSKARSALARRFTDLIEAPSRQEMNETYEAIQELRREVRTLRRNQKRLEVALAATREGQADTK